MKIKGINPIERHIEKIVLGVVALLFLGALASQFLLETNSVDVGGGKTAAPGQIYQTLKQRAESLQASLEDPSPSLPEVDTTDLRSAYEEGVGGAVSAGASLPVALGREDALSGIGNGEIIDIGTGGPLQAVAIPALADPVASAQWNTIDPYALEAMPELRSAVGAQAQPYDVVTVSVQGTFDASGLRDALTGAGMPRKLWQGGGMTALGVQIERQAFVDGAWGASEPAGMMPGGDPMLAMGDSPDMSILVSRVRDAKDLAGQVVQPDFYPTISGRTWVPPRESFEREARLSNSSDADRLRDQIARVEEEIAELERGGGRRQAARPARSGGGGDPRAGNVRGGDPRGAATRPGAGANRANDGAQRQIESKRRQIERYKDRLTALGFDADAPMAQDRSRSSDDADGAPDLFGSGPVEVWAHDPQAEPGARYRYRMRVVFNNPLYDRGGMLDPDDPDQQALASSPTVQSAWSGWSSAIDVPQRTYLFVTGVSDQNTLTGVPRVTAEVYTMHYGYYRRSAVSLEPGDTVRGSAGLPGTLVTFDTAVADMAAADEALDTVAGGAGFTPVDLPAGVSVDRSGVAFDLGNAFVDLRSPALSAAGAGATREVVFRTPTGGLVVRSADEDSGPAYDRASSSAEEGELAILARTWDGEAFTRGAGGTDRGNTTDTGGFQQFNDPDYVDPRSVRDRPGGP